jgi:hypothetical protein
MSLDVPFLIASSGFSNIYFQLIYLSVYLCPPVSSTNKTDHQATTEILLKVALSTIKQTNKQTSEVYCSDINSSIS